MSNLNEEDREKIRNDLRWMRILAYHNIPDVTEADIDAVIEGPKRAE